MDDGKWKMDDGEWLMENGRWKMDDGEFFWAFYAGCLMLDS